MANISVGSLARTGASFVVSAGVGSLIGNLAKQSTPEKAKKLRRISIYIGGFVLSNMVAEAASAYVNKNIDDGVKEFNKTKEAFEKRSARAETAEKVDEIKETIKTKASAAKNTAKQTAEDILD